jgi:hypothetical protein
MKLKNLVKACSKGEARPNIENVNVRRGEDGATVCEATDGHICMQITYPVKQGPAWLADLAPGMYPPADWVDLVCKGRPATPMVTTMGFPDFSMVIPKEGDAVALKQIGIDLALINVLTSILDTPGVTFMFTGDISPIRIDYTDGEGSAVAVIMPWKLP